MFKKMKLFILKIIFLSNLIIFAIQVNISAGEDELALTYNWIPQYYGKIEGDSKLLYTRSFSRSQLRFVDIDNDAASNLILDGSGLSSFANGAKVDIRRIWWGLTQGTAAGNTGDVEIEFKGSSSDTHAIRLAGSGHYDGTAGLIEGNATNTTATSADVEASTFVLPTNRFDLAK